MRSVSVWPGYVDALSALLMVVIFVLLIFAIAHFLLSQVLSSQESELASLHQRVNELVELLGLETQRSEALRTEAEELSGRISTLSGEKEALRSEVADLSRQSALGRSSTIPSRSAALMVSSEK